MTFGDKLLQLRKARGFSQEELSIQLNVSRQAISRWELGSALPDMPNLLQISRLFGVTADYLIDDNYGAGLDAAGAPPTAVSAPTPPPQKRGLLILGIIFSTLGGLGNLVILILSTMIRSRVNVTYQDDFGQTWYTTEAGYSLSGFIEKFRLELLVWLLVLCLLTGIFLLALWFYHRRNSTSAGQEPDPQ